MTPITITLAIIGGALCFFASPGWALATYCAGLFLYPQPLTVVVGGVNFSLSRLLILPLLLNAVLRGHNLRDYKYHVMDACVLAMFVCSTAGVDGERADQHDRAAPGREMFDTLLPYVAVRLLVNSKDKLIGFFKTLVIIGIPLAVGGAYEALTGHNPIGWMAPYFAWGLASEDATAEVRHGFTGRA